MRLGLLAGLAAVLMISVSATEADARWTCRATSSTGSWGVGWHNYSRSYAHQRSLVECAVRTPRYATCYVRWCRRS
jgi:hypothetical protein